MTALFNLGAAEITDTERAQRVLDDARADHGLSTVLEHAKAVGGRVGLSLLNGYQNRIAATRSQMLAEFVQDDGDNRRAERMADDGRTSKREQRKQAARAAAVARNKALADKLAQGEINEEQLDVIADASAKTDGEAAVDADLIDKVAAVPPERGKSIVDDYVAARATKDGVQTEYKRQRALRRASKYVNKAKGLNSIGLDGDGVSSKVAWAAIEKRAQEIYARDGGRDLPAGQHPRTREQRLYDAAFELITGQTTTPGGRTRPDTPKVGSKKSSGGIPQIVIGLTIDYALGIDPAAMATQVGLGLIPDSVLANYAGHADFFAAIYGRNGEPLWLARLNRYASTTQMLALILRDRGCVLCGADHTRCQAHHAMPFNAPGKGRTDLDDLVLLCVTCHQRLHADHHTIFQDLSGEWRTRAATADEIPAPRPNTVRNTPRLE